MKTLLLPPGIGDNHWILLKLRSFMEVHAPGETFRAHIWNPDGKPRALEWLQRIPWLEVGGYFRHPWTHEYNEVYGTGPRQVIEGFEGFDYLIGVNPALERGCAMSEVLPECVTEWDYEVVPTEEEMQFGEHFLRHNGPYILLFFCNHGFYAEHWLQSLSVKKLVGFIQALATAYPHTKLVLTGKDWDVDFSTQLAAAAGTPQVISLAGQTTLPQLLGLIRHARAFVGFPAGNGMVAQHLGCPTLMIWCGESYRARFHKDFSTNWVDPKKVGSVYTPVYVDSFQEDVCLSALNDMERARRQLMGRAQVL